jgi:hypothetical protein
LKGVSTFVVVLEPLVVVVLVVRLLSGHHLKDVILNALFLKVAVVASD